MTTDETTSLVRAYYDTWKNGAARFDRPRLTEILAPDLSFEGPRGTRIGAGSVCDALEKFVGSLRGLEMLQLMASGDDAVAVYDCALSSPVPRLRCAELFRVSAGRIRELRLIYDASGFRAAS